MLFDTFLIFCVLIWNTLPFYPPTKLYSFFKAQVKRKCFMKFFLTQIGVSYFPLCHHVSVCIPPVTGFQFPVCVSDSGTILNSLEVRDYVFVYSAFNMVPRMY